MLYVGVDQHKKFSQVAVVNESGEVLENRRVYHDDKDEIKRFFRELGEESTAVLEATRNWYWLYDLLEEEVREVKLCHPAKVRLIAEAKVKTDKIDATVLAQLKRTGYLPESYAPPREIRERREVHRFRISLVRIQTGLKNRVHAVLAKLGIEHPWTDLFGAAGREFLSSLSLPEAYQLELESCLRLLDRVGEEIRLVQKEIRKTVKEDPRAQLLMSVPGIGETLAYLILYEVGEISRFSSPKKFASYCALTARTRQSADRVWQGHISRQGNVYLKWALIEASHIAARKDPALTAVYNRKRRTKGSGKAIVYVARKLATAIYHMLQRGENYKYNCLTKVHLGKPCTRLGRS